MTDLVTLASTPLARGWPAPLGALVEKVNELYSDFHHEVHRVVPGPRLEGLVAKVEGMQSHIPSLVAVVQAAQSPATREEIAKCLALLVVAYPNAGAKADLAGYGQLIVEDVNSLAPSIGAVDRACRELRQTKTFLPAIAEVIEAVRDGEKQLTGCAWRLGRLPEYVSKARQALANEAALRERMARQAEVERQHRETVATRREISLSMRLGVRIPSHLDAALVAEALVEWRDAHGTDYAPRVWTRCAD